jgi:hypothetical protein
MFIVSGSATFDLLKGEAFGIFPETANQNYKCSVRPNSGLQIRNSQSEHILILLWHEVPPPAEAILPASGFPDFRPKSHQI